MKAHWKYFLYVIRHKYYVLKASRKLKVLIYLRLLHDWSKFLPSEWFPYVHTFYKKDGSSQYNETKEFAIAWNSHQKRNKHHWQYWLLTWDRGEEVPLYMPTKYANEMLADWMGAGLAITGKDNTYEWYQKNKINIKLHKYTRNYIEATLVEGKELSKVERLKH